ncbi:MAG: DUF3291 domain-containing protein [Acidimicrobiia bacterium]|nr:DUF3291 domain-containing protein [Acidimicrobiia bacterium]
MKYHLAQYNVARLLAPLDDPAIVDFVSALEPINRLADESPGFVWRHQTEEGDSTALRPYDDDRIIINFSVWTDPDALWDYTYKSDHMAVFRRRREWFESHVEAHLVMWWVPEGHIPSTEEASERLERLRIDGPTPEAFTFRQRFDPPD